MYKFSKILLLGLLIVSCNTHKMKLFSNLIYSDPTNKIISFDFSESREQIIYVADRRHFIGHLSKKTKTIFFYAIKIYGDPGRQVIKEFNLKTKKNRVLFEGEMPQYIPNANLLFFYQQDNYGKKWLSYVSLDSEKQIVKVALAPPLLKDKKNYPISLIEPVVAISDNEIIFLDQKIELSIFNFKDSTIHPLKIKGYLPIGWREKTKHLIVNKYPEYDVGFLDLEKKQYYQISGLKDVPGIAYFPKKDLLFYSQYKGFVARQHTYVKNLTTGKSQHLLPDRMRSGFFSG